MRYFNTSGPCDPSKHYTVMREALLATGKRMVEQGRYFTIFAPRQSGKTTYFRLLSERIAEDGHYLPVWISIEGLKTLDRPQFYRALEHRLRSQLKESDIQVNTTITDQFTLELFLEEVYAGKRGLVLILDEFEDVPDNVLSELMHTFRAMYHQSVRSLHSLILVGVSTVAELVVSSASPFNIAEELQLPYFTSEEVQDIIRQYVAESGQGFHDDVITAIYTNTVGQPGLVCGLCGHLVEHVAMDRSKPVAMSDFYPTLKHFLKERFDKNILNIVRKAREKREFMLSLLFSGTPKEFTIDEPDMAYLYAHGVLENINGVADVLVPLYKKRLITAFRPLINGETEEYFSAHDTFAAYLSDDGLQMLAILEKYRQYVRKRGFRAFDTEQFKEAAWHYSLDGFINFFIDSLEGQTFIEVPTGRGRTDILILFRGRKYIIETKIFTTQHAFQKGKRQLAEYLSSEGLDEGYYVVFSKKHAEEDQLDFDDEIQGKRIHSLIVRTQFDRATNQPATKA